MYQRIMPTSQSVQIKKINTIHYKMTDNLKMRFG